VIPTELFLHPLTAIAALYLLSPACSESRNLGFGSSLIDGVPSGIPTTSSNIQFRLNFFFCENFRKLSWSEYLHGLFLKHPPRFNVLSAA
jgi:hypothetical protein